jgi:hypothetical protein
LARPASAAILTSSRSGIGSKGTRLAGGLGRRGLGFRRWIAVVGPGFRSGGGHGAARAAGRVVHKFGQLFHREHLWLVTGFARSHVMYQLENTVFQPMRLGVRKGFWIAPLHYLSRGRNISAFTAQFPKFVQNGSIDRQRLRGSRAAVLAAAIPYDPRTATQLRVRQKYAIAAIGSRRALSFFTYPHPV